jgi:cyclopropane fatty-acyl-phospholipid synthase-like methyltransferase
MSHSAARVVSPESFEQRYRSDPDPWNYRSSPYERGKYGVTLASLAREHYGAIFEPACSVGELTALLAPRCDRLLAIDVSDTAVKLAQGKLAQQRHVTIECQDARTFIPREQFDLIVFSELGYYFDLATLQQLARRFAQCLARGGEFIAVHWRGHSADHVLHGDEVHSALRHCLPLHHRVSERHPGFHVDSWLAE